MTGEVVSLADQRWRRGLRPALFENGLRMPEDWIVEVREMIYEARWAEVADAHDEFMSILDDNPHITAERSHWVMFCLGYFA